MGHTIQGLQAARPEPSSFLSGSSSGDCRYLRGRTLSHAHDNIIFPCFGLPTHQQSCLQLVSVHMHARCSASKGSASQADLHFEGLCGKRFRELRDVIGSLSGIRHAAVAHAGVVQNQPRQHLWPTPQHSAQLPAQRFAEAATY